MDRIGTLLRGFVGLLVVALATGPSGCASLDEPVRTEQVTVRDLLVDPQSFRNRYIAVTGRVSRWRVETSSGRPTQAFTLDDGGLPIEVRSLVGPGGCQPPQPVTVEGWFRAPRTGLGVGVIEATRVVCQ